MATSTPSQGAEPPDPKHEQISQFPGDLEKLLAATEVRALFLDRDLRLRYFTPRLADLFNITPDDRGRPIGDFTHRLDYEGLEADARQVLDNLRHIEREVRSREGRWYLARLRPYRTVDNRIDGVVVTFVDITERKQAEQEIQSARQYAESIVETIHEPLVVLTADLRVKSANPAFYEQFRVRPEQTEGRLIYELGNNQWNIPELRRLLEDILPENNVFTDYEVSHDFEKIGRRVMLLNGRQLDHVQLILLAIEDISERKRAEEILRASEERLRRAFQIETVGIIFFKADGSIVDTNDAFLRMSGYSREELEQGLIRWDEMTPPEWMPPSLKAVSEFEEKGYTTPYEKEYIRKDGSRWWALFAATRLDAEVGVEYVVDITARKEAEAQLRQITSRLTMAEQEERRRLSQILHDDLQQLLYGIQMKLEFIREAAEAGEPERSVAHAQELATWIDDAITMTRRLTVDLSPPVLQGEGLTAALGWLVSQMAELHGLQVQVEVEAESLSRLTKIYGCCSSRPSANSSSTWSNTLGPTRPR